MRPNWDWLRSDACPVGVNLFVLVTAMFVACRMWAKPPSHDAMIWFAYSCWVAEVNFARFIEKL